MVARHSAWNLVAPHIFVKTALWTEGEYGNKGCAFVGESGGDREDSVSVEEAGDGDEEESGRGEETGDGNGEGSVSVEEAGDGNGEETGEGNGEDSVSVEETGDGNGEDSVSVEETGDGNGEETGDGNEEDSVSVEETGDCNGDSIGSEDAKDKAGPRQSGLALLPALQGSQMTSEKNERREGTRRRRMDLLSSIFFYWRREEMERENDEGSWSWHWEPFKVYLWDLLSGEWVTQENRKTMQILPCLKSGCLLNYFLHLGIQKSSCQGFPGWFFPE